MGSTTGKLSGAQGCPETPKVSKLSAFPAMSPLLEASWAGVRRSCHIPADLERQDEESQSREEGALTGISLGAGQPQVLHKGRGDWALPKLPSFLFCPHFLGVLLLGLESSQGRKLWLVKILGILDWCHNPAQVICEGTQAKEFMENCPQSRREPNQDGAEF